uniref:SFRICE_023397 n=1 Tax=Spodoptera frugiperda TaxID=7108 RepID=A0A2H1VRB9_SPOFR
MPFGKITWQVCKTSKNDFGMDRDLPMSWLVKKLHFNILWYKLVKMKTDYVMIFKKRGLML